VPSVVSRAIRFIKNNLTARVAMTEVSTVSGVSQRTLRRQFKRFTGQAPLAFHRNLRLDAAHRILKSRGNVDVTTVAAECGFIHFGQFAARYR